MFYDQQQRLHRGLPFFGIVLCFRKLGDVERGVAQRDQVLAPGNSMGSANLRSHDIGSRQLQGQLPVGSEVAVYKCLYR